MTIELFLLNFLYSVVATVIGGAVLAVLFFWLREEVLPLPRIMGRWFFEMHTINSSYGAYKDMKLCYVAMLWRENSRIRGTIEKYYEDSVKQKKGFEEKSRTRGIVDGFIEKNYFSKDRVVLHIIEDGHGRESTHYFDLVVSSAEEMEGIFTSMVARQDGNVRWQRTEF